MHINSSSVSYAMNVYKNQVANNPKVSSLKVNTHNSDIKVHHNTNANAKIKSMDVQDVNTIEPKNNFIPSKELKSSDAAIAKVQRDIFSPEDNELKAS